MMPADSPESPPLTGPPGPAVPADWPAAWAQLYPPLRDRAVFVGMTIFLTGIGLALLGDPAAQWWAIALPVLLLIGPALHPVRARRMLQTAVLSGRANAQSGRLLRAGSGADGWLEPDNGDPTVPLGFRGARRAGARQAGAPVLLVWHRRYAALVLDGYRVLYLDERPRGIRADPVPPPVHDVTGRLAGS